MLVFRNERRRGRAGDLIRPLRVALNDRSSEGRLSALILAGMLESALADAGCPAVRRAATVTDALARELVTSLPPRTDLARQLERVPASQEIGYSSPEGFAFYDVHPLQYASAVAAFPKSITEAPSAAVIGIRSIGTSLGAAVAAGLSQRGIHVERVSVRPSGPPYDRRMDFSDGELAWIARCLRSGPAFIVVDEGPGRSGSSFLSVGDALLAQGVPRDHILFVGSVEPDVARLCAPDAARRWPRFASCVVPGRHRTWEAGAEDWGAGQWRNTLLDGHRAWPPSWIQFERKKFARPERGILIKFEGLGPFGQAAFERAQVLADSGFSAPVQWLGDGYLQYSFMSGRPANALTLCREILDVMAEYLAFRRRAFSQPRADPEAIAKMVSTNYAEVLGVQPEGPLLSIENPVLVDGRMHPHEWISTNNGWMKVDGVDHGDDHFFPGAADIAWDIAGAMIEWEMPRSASEYVLSRYQTLTGDDARARLPSWMLAYAAFRMAYTRMAAEAMSGTEEEARLQSSYRNYRSAVVRLSGRRAA